MKPKWLAGSLLFGCGLTAVLLHSGRAPGRHWFDSILWIGYLAGSLVSGNLHSPNEPVAWMTLAVSFAALAYGALALIHALKSRRSAATHS